MMALQSTQLATQQANQQAMQAHLQAIQNSQLPTDITPNPGDGIALVQRPKFTVKPGVVEKGTRVRLECSTRDATIFYTTDGWTATERSAVYDGPIVINATTHISAIAVAPHLQRSLVANGAFIVAGAPETPENTVSTNGVLKAGTPLRLTVVAGADSKTAEIGDPLKLALDEDVTVGDAVALKKGTEVTAKIIALNRSAHAGMPGDLTFVVRAIQAPNLTVPLIGGATLEGADGVGKIKSLFFFPVVGTVAVAIHGDEATITPGMTLMASVATDTLLRP